MRRYRRRVTDNANEAAKMKPRAAEDADCGSGGGGLVGPFCFFFGDAFADAVGLGWRCLSSESDIGEGVGWVVEGSGCPRWCTVYTSAPRTHWRLLIRTPGELSPRRESTVAMSWSFLHTNLGRLN